MNLFTFLIVTVLVTIVAFSFFVIGFSYGTLKGVKTLVEKGWTFTEPKEDPNAE